MAVELVAVPPSVERSAPTIVARCTARRSLRSGALWGGVFAVVVASSALSYARLYPSDVDRRRLAAGFSSNHAAAALFGPAPQLQTAAGFTVFKVSMTLMIVGALWGLLTSTRLLRGDEDAGRWELLLSGLTTRRRAVAQALAGLAAGAAVIWAVTAVATVLVGRASSVHVGVGAALYFTLALVSSAVMFLAVGAATSQLASNRRRAAGYAAVVLGMSYGLRMVADAGTGLHWLVWASPLGWVEQLRPLTGPRPSAFLPVVAFTAAMAILAVHLAGHRDVGAGTWPDRTTRAARTGLLSGPTALTLRLTRSSIAGWTAAMAVAGLMIGIVAKAAGATIVGSSVQQVFSRLGARGSGTSTFLGVSFLILAMVVALQAASQVSAARDEETEGRLDHLFAALVGRSRWFAGRFGVATAALVLSGAGAGISAWAGAATQGAEAGLATTLEAGVNVVPPAVFLLGIGALALGLWPRRATAVVYAVLGWSALVELAAGFFAQSRWVLDTSVFHHVASAPAVAPDWRANGVLAGVGVMAMVAGDRALVRRDLAGQ